MPSFTENRALKSQKLANRQAYKVTPLFEGLETVGVNTQKNAVLSHQLCALAVLVGDYVDTQSVVLTFINTRKFEF